MRGPVPAVLLSCLAIMVGIVACSSGERFPYNNYAPLPSASATAPEHGLLPPRGPQPVFGKTVSLSNSPPPISGGTLVVSIDGKRAVVADPDRDLVFVVNLVSLKVESTIVLEKGDEPGRVVEDDEGRFHVVLRRAGAIVTITVKEAGAPPTTERRAVCPAPRGIAFDSFRAAEMPGRLLIACEGGELMTLSPAPPIGQGLGAARAPNSIEGTEPTAMPALVKLERDLRDVVVTRDRIFVSTFRSARVIELGIDGSMITSARIPTPRGSKSDDAPMLAFRMVQAAPASNADPLIVHEVALPGALSTAPGGYYGGSAGGGASPCAIGSVVRSVLSRGGVNGGTLYLPNEAVLPVDVATDGETIAMIAAGNGHTPTLPQLYFVSSLTSFSDPCSASPKPFVPPVNVQLSAVAFRRSNAVIVQSREPAELMLVPEGTRISLSNVSREDTGHAIFHSNAGVGASCASCHAEGGDDGRVWDFLPGGPRRTPSLRGTLAGTSPYHWEGDVANIAQLADDVLAGRMSGPHLDGIQKGALESWLFAIPAPIPSIASNDEAAVRGRDLFERKDVGCTNCHAGPHMTTGVNADVGTGGSFQVPSLIGVSARTPLLHTGCALRVRDRFNPACGGSKHGNTSHLVTTQIDDLVRYLESL